jgi:ribosomal RNA-processing protein 36
MVTITKVNSSSSSDDQSSGDGSESEIEKGVTYQDDQSSADDNDNSESEEEDDDDDDEIDHSSNDDDDDEEAFNGSEQEDDTPLEERIRNQREAGVDMRASRDRKSKALKLARERLAATKKTKSDTLDDSKKKSKHAPTEASSKRSDFFNRKLQLNETGVGVNVGEHRYKPRDPRISNLSGHLDVDHFQRNYAFLEEMRDKEIALLKKKIAARNVTGKKGQQRRGRLGITHEGSLDGDKETLKQLQQEKAEYQRSQIERAAKGAVKKKIHQDVADGKRGVYFLKRKDKRKLELEAKFEVMRERGGDKAVEKAVAKRRKKNKSRDASRLGGRTAPPYQSREK